MFVRSIPFAALALFTAAVALTGQRNGGAPWWKNAVLYEIYPRSFGDTNGDGIGDLNGITDHLDYLRDLGVDAIWITPFYPSPQVDFGYDISDYRAIDPQYGTMADFDRLVAEAQRRNIRVITDLVLNHTSDRHPWFIESKSSRTNPKADWYVWRDAKPGGGPPNNWESIFGHSAWQWDPARKQYYYHAFYKEQPDLNWRNPQLRKAMYDVARFWMQHGSAGFRLDAITSLFEDPQWRDEPIVPGKFTPFGDPVLTRQYTDNLPQVHEVLREMRKVTDEFPGRILVGEVYLPNVAELAKMYGAHNDELQLPMDTQYGFIDRLSADAFRQKLREAETDIGGNDPLFVFDNHDNRRSWNRYGDGKHDEAIAKLIAALLLTPRCAALIYYGQELGMQNNDPKRIEDVRDPKGRTGWPKDIGRDGERTPMQWTSGRNAGFGSGTTWLPVAPDYRAKNAASEAADRNSMLNFYKTLIRLRRENDALRDGSLTMVDASDHDVLSFVRVSGRHRVLVALNFTAAPHTIDYTATGVRASGTHALLASFANASDMPPSRVELPAYGAYIAELQ